MSIANTIACAALAFSVPGPGRTSFGWRPAAPPRAAVTLSEPADSASIQLSVNDPRLVTVTLDKTTGIDFGCDLSLRWPYVLALTPGGAAERQAELRIGDQLLSIAGDSVIGQSVAGAMEKIAAADGRELEMLFFRGTRASLQALCAVEQGPATILLTLERSGKPDEVPKAVDWLSPPSPLLMRALPPSRRLSCHTGATCATSSSRERSTSTSRSRAGPTATASSSAAPASSTWSAALMAARAARSTRRRRCERTQGRTSWRASPTCTGM